MAIIEYVTDNLGLSNTYNKGPQAGYLSINADLYHQIFSIAYDKAIVLTVRWVPSHLLEEPTKGVYSCISYHDMLGNSHADSFAGEACRVHCVPLNVSAPIVYYIMLCTRIQHRLATILVNLPNGPKPPKKPALPKDSIPTLIANTTHIIHEGDNRVSCARCRNSFKATDPALRGWLSCRCTAIGSSSDRPTPLRFEELHLGNRTTHSSHNLLIFRGLVFCSKCGARSGRLGFKLLANKCLPPKGYGLASLNALREGKPPPNLSRWPDENTPISTCDPAQSREGLRGKELPFMLA